MRTAIVHYWLLRMRGGEKVLEALCGLLPGADIFALFCDPESISPKIRAHRIQTSFLQPYRRHYRSLLPLMPMALENFDLRDYDLVVSSESGPAKGVLVKSTARHVCYCHTPMRYLWDLYPAYRNDWTRSRWRRALLTPLSHYLRMYDYASAARVDQFVANSENVRRRIWRTYRREAEVIYPPVDVESFRCDRSADYYLIVSELVSYKQLDYAVRAFARSGRKLRIAGNGPEYRSLRRLAASNIEFCGHVSDAELRDLYAHARALILPGEEDFGITAVESLASGKPVIALRRGGALETVPEDSPACGILYDDAEETSLNAALESFESRERSFAAPLLQQWARRFSEEEFAVRMRAVLFEASAAAAGRQATNFN